MSFCWRNRSRTLGAVGGLAAITSLLLSGSAFGDGQSGPPEIRWDQFGIPHIYGPDLLTVVRGLGYAEMENHAETILMNAAAARGRSAAYFGPGACNPQGVCANIQNDMLVRTEDIPSRAQAWLDNGGQNQRDIIQAFTDGANEYVTRHGNTINPVFQQVLPLVPTDVTAGIQYVVHFHMMPSQDNLPALIAAWQSGGISVANVVACNFTPGCSTSTAVASNTTHGGSNGWAIAPSKSASGNAILMGNPHLPWGNNQPVPGFGIYQFMEANLVIGDREHPKLNASGVVFAGAPFIAIGYSDEIGWTHTNNTIQNTNLYELTLTLNPDSSITYKFGNGVRPLLCRPDAIKVQQANDIPFSICTSVHGPVIAQNGNKALALRVAGLDQPSAVTQYWGMIQAHNLQDFIAANSALQMPFFNVVYADRDGHILYLFGGQQPVRQGGDWGKYSGILDGSDPSLLWTDTFTWPELPQAIDPPGGFVANSNNPPWTSTFPQTRTNNPAKFPAYVAPQFMDMRAQNGADFLRTGHRLTFAEVLSGKESTHMLLADRVLPDLIKAAQASGDPTALQAANTLATWDRNADATSKGAVLFEAWWTNVFNDLNSNLALPRDNTINYYSPHPPFRVGWDPHRPLDTPVGLTNAAAWVPDLIKAAQQVFAAYGALNVAWGDVHRIVLATHLPTFQTTIPVSDAPQSGADDPFGPLRVLFRYPLDMKHFFAVSGDGYVQLVEFAKDGAKAQALLGYGNASRPVPSPPPPLPPHVTDQLQFFEDKTLRPVYRTRDDVIMHTFSLEPY
jgi:acyl-homoserine-lactone acylase